MFVFINRMKILLLSGIILLIPPFQAGSLCQEAPLQSFAYLAGYGTSDWKQSPPPPFSVQCFSGSVIKGLVVFGGSGNKQNAYMKVLPNGQWETLADAPFAIQRCSGDNSYGPLISGGEGSRFVAFMRDYGKNVWKIVAMAPFNVIDIAGDNAAGPVIAGGQNKKQVAFMRDYQLNEWKVVAEAPFEIACIAGDNVKGMIIAGGKENRQVAVMRDYTGNEWQILSDAPFSITDIAGTNTKGPIILGGRGNVQIAYMDNYEENKWKVLVNAPFSATEIAGTNDGGILVGATGQQFPRLVIKKVYKTAVVEFEERGSLGIQDAGAIIAEWITTSLNKTGAFEVYERLSLHTLMEEHKLGQTGLMDEETMARIGRLRGVQAIVTGSVSKFADIISVTAKVVDVETAKIMQSADIKVSDINEIPSKIDGLAMELAK